MRHPLAIPAWIAAVSLALIALVMLVGAFELVQLRGDVHDSLQQLSGVVKAFMATLSGSGSECDPEVEVC